MLTIVSATPRMRTPYGIVSEATAQWLCRNSIIRYDSATETYSVLSQLVTTVRCRTHGYDKERQRYTVGHKCYRAVGDAVIQRLVANSQDSPVMLMASDVVNMLADGRINYSMYLDKMISWMSTVPAKKQRQESPVMALAGSDQKRNTNDLPDLF